jgi:hypothetical protein
VPRFSRGAPYSQRKSILASGQIVMRKIDGWESLAEKPSDQIIDLAA